MKSATRILLPLLIATSVAAWSQTPIASTRVDWGSTTASPNDYSVSYGHTNKRPRNYNYWYYNDASQYALSPYLNFRPQKAPTRHISGPARPYSDTEYGRLILSTINAENVSPSSYSNTMTSSIVRETTSTPTGITLFDPAETQIVDVMDRGIMVAPTREEIRLRGVRLPSQTSTDDVTRMYAREAQATIRKLTQDKKVYILFDTPLRDSQGYLLGTVYLPDGTELNRLMIDEGYGTVRQDDFSPDVDFSDLETAQAKARTKQIGMWSRLQ